ncbi:hypothetical protein [Bradyrhizobium erythrophlei]|uniref:Uncharacterized protein n=1 Tax=Bradyrhizobium erythrophlei TaxID=1437360 RepID=A0A1H4YLT0_9BRAD|nr:hypothetical protein [Bradyrhizobium erythrophlei]SED18912.1 hypothetical protein SAMN05444164_4008 [Bradyrhizobium erythrophlei]
MRSSFSDNYNALFPIRDEFLLADAILSFADAFKGGKTPQQAYEAFDILVAAVRCMSPSLARSGSGGLNA